ncbi:hypothetical protein ACTOB_004513 [Actinoplanes oblitus]|uniref:Uncharacterized protein n=1 Tax=Actinoplanes oblitus TaxID=3040509 RepID=A0ABY8W6C4_9ACTN|nr:hypothetical protein [Actinoplanes oblitus]WIM92568.1 hypothetical protein ACTOB_004513 [Actinoplanes oblitus]
MRIAAYRKPGDLLDPAPGTPGWFTPTRPESPARYAYPEGEAWR